MLPTVLGGSKQASIKRKAKLSMLWKLVRAWSAPKLGM